MKKALIIFLLIFSVSSLSHAGQGTYTFTAPSPTGHYQKLTLVAQTGALPACNATVAGTTYRRRDASGDIRTYFCTPSGWQIIYPWYQNEAHNRVYLSEPDATSYSTLNVGIGTDRSDSAYTPFRLTIDDDGGILARGTFGSGVDIPTGTGTFLDTGMGTVFMWHPQKAALRAVLIDNTGYGSGIELQPNAVGDFSVAFGKNTGSVMTGGTVSGGEKNVAYGAYASVGGGYDNVAGLETVYASLFGTHINTYDYTTIGGGYQNRANEHVTTISGGENNVIQSKYGTIAGGEDNLIYLAASGWSTIGGGRNNSAGSAQFYGIEIGAHATVAGGSENQALGFASTVSGGYENVITEAVGATISGGGQNTIAQDALGSVISGGHLNRVLGTGVYSVIGGGGGIGQANETSGLHTTIGGGASNNASGTKSTIAGGQLHQTKANFGFIGGGTNNTVGDNVGNGIYGSILGGRNNVVEGDSAAVAGGAENAANGNYAFIAGGTQNTAHGDYSLAAGQKIEIAAAADNTFAWGHDDTNPITITQPDSFIIATGNMGVGTIAPTHTLHVNNVLRLEPTEDAPLCDDSNIGIMYVDSDTNDLCICRGSAAPTGWANLTTPGSPDVCN